MHRQWRKLEKCSCALPRRLQVPLTTITKSKGLEYAVVVLLGLDDNDWWSFQRNPDEGHSTFFVAASRAHERLFMTLCEGQRTSKVKEIYELLMVSGQPKAVGCELRRANADVLVLLTPYACALPRT
jgi:superfamily I DNA/RNA helicase